MEKTNIKMKILVFGKNGQVGSKLSKFKNVISISREEGNFLDTEKVISLIDKYDPSIVINSVAKTDVDLCEKEKSESEVINTITPIEIAKKCKLKMIPFIHISSDYVFDGIKTSPYEENDLANPLNYYGLTKINADRAITNLDFSSVILRTSWIFSESKKNFVSKIIDQVNNKKKIKVVNDQFGSPTSAQDIADVCLIISNFLNNKKKIKKLYHYSSFPITNFYDYAKEIISYSNNKYNIDKVKTSDMSYAALRPKYSYLNCDSIINDLGISRPNWKKSLSKIFEKK